MRRLEKQLKALQDHLAKLSAQADKARGQAGRRLKRLERRTRVKVGRTVRALEPKVRQAVAEATVIARGVRAGVRAGVAAYRTGRPRKR
jgi:predicted metal-dependent hydrolase